MTKPAISIPNPTCVVCSTEMVLRPRFNKRFGRQRYAGSYFRCLQCGRTMGLDVWQQECADRTFLELMSDLPSAPACPNVDDLDLDFDLGDLVQPPPVAGDSELDALFRAFGMDDLVEPPPAEPEVLDPPEPRQPSNVIVLATHPFWISRRRGRC